MDCHFLLPGDLPNPGIEPLSLTLAGGFFTTEAPGKPRKGQDSYDYSVPSPPRQSFPPILKSTACLSQYFCLTLKVHLETSVKSLSLTLFFCLHSCLNGEGNGTPLQYSCLENPMDGGAWKAAVHGVAKLDLTTKQQQYKYDSTQAFYPALTS